MSFLSRTTPVLRQSATFARQTPRLFTTTAVQQKSIPEAVKDTAKSVDRTVSDTLVSGIEKGTQAKDKAAAAAGVKASQAEGEAAELAGQAKGKAAELKGKAKGAAEEAKGKL